MSRQLQAAFKGPVGGFDLDVDFEAPMSGISALFGPSGSGKTTLLRCIAGLERVPGRLMVGETVWQDKDTFLKPHRRAIGYVFQEASLFEHLSVRQNLLFGAKRAGMAKFGFDDVVALLGIGRLLDRAPMTLSGGERQRIAVGRALLSQPELLLMDEPLSALDERSREDVLSYFEALHRDLRLPILYVSHDTAEVARLADHMLVMADGRITASGPARSLFERLDFMPPEGRFEAGVVLTATISAQDEGYRLTRLDHHGQTLSIPMVAGPVGTAVDLRIRARDVALATHRPEGISIRNMLKGTIAELREDQETTFVDVLVDIGGAALRAQVTREARAELALLVGTPVFALVKSITFDGHKAAH